MKIIYKLTIIAHLLLLAGCFSTEGANELADAYTNPQNYLPRAMARQPFYNTPTGRPVDGTIGDYNNDYNSDSYGQGFEDGCRTYTGTLGSGTLRLIDEKIDGHRMATDEWYLRGFQDASGFCTFSLDWETH